jgi:glucosamine-6-phosphate deaminase
MSLLSHALKVRIFSSPEQATQFASDWLVEQLTKPEPRNVMLAGGNTPLALYASVAERRPLLSHLTIFALDEYVGVPLDEPRNCANLIWDKAAVPWGIPRDQYHGISSSEASAQSAIVAHEEKIRAAGGLDLVVLGLGRNGHVGFNEPGSDALSCGRVVALERISIEANRQWFQGDYAPGWGVTTGMKTILAAKRVLLLAFGPAKAAAVAAMIDDAPSSSCPASFLQTHPGAFIVLDERAAAQLKSPA